MNPDKHKLTNQLIKNTPSGNGHKSENKIQWACSKCTYINRSSFSSCAICYSLPDISAVEKGISELPITDHLSLPVKKLIESSTVNTKNVTKTGSIGDIIGSLYREMRYRKNVLRSNEWDCTKCQMRNQSAFCEACFNASPYNGKWKCESCACLNKYSNKNCNLCQSPNPNITTCRYCRKAKIPNDRTLCDNCFVLFPMWICSVRSCGRKNTADKNYCDACGFSRMRPQKTVVIPTCGRLYREHSQNSSLESIEIF